MSRLARERAPMPAEALTTDSSIITAIGNDYGFDRVFERQLAAKATRRDVFLGITTSGASPNILRALEHCRAAGVPAIVLTGRSGGAARRADRAPIPHRLRRRGPRAWPRQRRRHLGDIDVTELDVGDSYAALNAL